MLKKIIAFVVIAFVITIPVFAQGTIDDINNAKSEDEIGGFLEEIIPEYCNFDISKKEYICRVLLGYVDKHNFKDYTSLKNTVATLSYNSPKITSEVVLMNIMTEDEQELIDDIRETHNLAEVKSIIEAKSYLIDSYSVYSSLTTMLQEKVASEIIGSDFTDINKFNNYFSSVIEYVKKKNNESNDGNIGGGGGNFYSFVDGFYYYSGKMSRKTINVDFSYQSKKNKNCNVVCAVYNKEGRLCNVDSIVKVLEDNTDDFSEINIDLNNELDTEKEYYLKIFLFDDIENLTSSKILHLVDGKIPPFEKIEDVSDEPTAITISDNVFYQVTRDSIFYYKNTALCHVMFDNSAEFYCDGEKLDSPYAYEEKMNEKFEFVLTDYDNNGYYDKAECNNYNYFFVDNYDATENKLYVDTNNPYGIYSYDSFFTLSEENKKNLDINQLYKDMLIKYKKITKEGNIVYEFKTCTPDIVSGIITEKSEINRVNGTKTISYTISDKTYECDLKLNMTPDTGELVTAYVYDGKIYQFRADETMNYGIVLKCAMNSTSLSNDIECKIYSQDDSEEIRTVSSKCSAWKLLYYNYRDFEGLLTAYRINENGEISSLYFADNISSCGNDLKFNLYYENTDGIYNKAANTLAGMKIADGCNMFVYDENNSSETIKKISCSDLVNEKQYDFECIKNYKDEVQALLIKNFVFEPDWDSEPLMINSISQVFKDNVVLNKITGIQNEHEVSLYTPFENELPEIFKGDVILYRADGNRIITAAYVLASLGSRNMELNVSDEADYSNGYNELSGNCIALDSHAISPNDYFNTETGVTSLCGFAVAGKAKYCYADSIGFINDYQKSFYYDDYIDSYERDYSDNECFVSFDSSTPVYKYVSYKKAFELSDISELETDDNTDDCYAEIPGTHFDYAFESELKNDDIAYTYYFNGKIKLVLIVDLDGDSENVLDTAGKYRFTVKDINESNIYFKDGFYRFDLQTGTYKITDIIRKLNVSSCDYLIIKDLNGNTLLPKDIESGKTIDLTILNTNSKLTYILNVNQ